MIVGYKKNSKRKDAMIYTRTNVNTIRNQSGTTKQNLDLDRWVTQLTQYLNGSAS